MLHLTMDGEIAERIKRMAIDKYNSEGNRMKIWKRLLLTNICTAASSSRKRCLTFFYLFTFKGGFNGGFNGLRYMVPSACHHTTHASEACMIMTETPYGHL